MGVGGPGGVLWGLEDLRGVAMGWGHPRSHCHLYGASGVTLRCHCPHLGPIGWPQGMLWVTLEDLGGPMGLEDLHGVTVGWGHPKSPCGVSCVTLRCHCPPLGPIWWPWGMCVSHWRTCRGSYGVGGPSWCRHGLGTPQIPLSPLWGFMCHPEVSLSPFGSHLGGPGGCVGHTGGPGGVLWGLEDLHGVTVGWGHPKSHCHLCGVLGSP